MIRLLIETAKKLDFFKFSLQIKQIIKIRIDLIAKW